MFIVVLNFKLKQEKLLESFLKERVAKLLGLGTEPVQWEGTSSLPLLEALDRIFTLAPILYIYICVCVCVCV
jgi:hypothetical protein